MEPPHRIRYDFALMSSLQSPGIGPMLREWRTRRRKSQFDLAGESHVSPRHLSFVETGRAQPSRDMVLLLAEHLDIPLRERNVLLTAAGFAPIFPQRPLESPEMAAARQTVELVLAGHEPFPALAVDRHWNLVASNRAVTVLLTGINSEQLQPPINVLRLSLHPAGLAPKIANYHEWRNHLLARLDRQIETSGDPVLHELSRELRSLPASPLSAPVPEKAAAYDGIAIPFELLTDAGKLTFLSTTTVFGTPVDITLAELAIESFFPADSRTAEIMRELCH